MDELTTIASFRTAAQAELLRGQLRIHGIESVLDGVEAATLWMPRRSGTPSVAVQVRESDARLAAQVVAEHEAAAQQSHAARPGAESCLACGAPLAASASRCAACGWTWETDAPA